MSLSPGTRLGPYEIIAPIGAGGIGEVSRARDTRLDRSVAIKLLHAGVSEKPELRHRFKREARRIESEPCRYLHAARYRTAGQCGLSGHGIRGRRHLASSPERKGDWPKAMCCVTARKSRMSSLPRTPVESFTGISSRRTYGHKSRRQNPGLRSGEELRSAWMRDSDASAAIHADPELRAILGTPAYMAPEQLEGEEMRSADGYLCVRQWRCMR